MMPKCADDPAFAPPKARKAKKSTVAAMATTSVPTTETTISAR